MSGFDEVALKSVSLIIRFFQLAWSLVVLSCTAQFVADISNAALSIPQVYTAVIAIAGMTATWSIIAMLLTCIAGSILLGIETSLDTLCMLLSIAETVLLSDGALASWSSFSTQYPGVSNLGYDQSLLRVSFIFAIIQIPLFMSTSLMSWAVFLMKRRHHRRHDHWYGSELGDEPHSEHHSEHHSVHHNGHHSHDGHHHGHHHHHHHHRHDED
jgi:membrane-associated HD superfamily phosphohydrolase